MNVEGLRHQYRPEKILTLFVGESAPSGGTFFYAENSQMYRYMREVFGNPPDFLSRFMSKGCFLDDLVLTPVNHRSDAERRAAHRASIPSLADRIAEYSPLAIVAVPKKIGPAVEEAIFRASSSAQHYVVAFPGNGQQGRFRREMAAIVPKLPLNPQSRAHVPTNVSSTSKLSPTGRRMELREVLASHGITSPDDVRVVGKSVRGKLRKRVLGHSHYERWTFIDDSPEHDELLQILANVLKNK